MARGPPAASNRPFSPCNHPLHGRGSLGAAGATQGRAATRMPREEWSQASAFSEMPAPGEQWNASTAVPSERGYAAWPQTAQPQHSAPAQSAGAEPGPHVSWQGLDHEAQGGLSSAEARDAEANGQRRVRPAGYEQQHATSLGHEAGVLPLQTADRTVPRAEQVRPPKCLMHAYVVAHCYHRRTSPHALLGRIVVHAGLQGLMLSSGVECVPQVVQVDHALGLPAAKACTGSSKQNPAADAGQLVHAEALMASTAAVEAAGPWSRSSAVDDMHAASAQLGFGHRVIAHERARVPLQHGQQRKRAADGSLSWPSPEAPAETPTHAGFARHHGAPEELDSGASLRHTRSPEGRPAVFIRLPSQAAAGVTAPKPSNGSTSVLAGQGLRRRLAPACRRQSSVLTAAAVQSAVHAALASYQGGIVHRGARPPGQAFDAQRDAPQPASLRTAHARTEAADSKRGRPDKENASATADGSEHKQSARRRSREARHLDSSSAIASRAEASDGDRRSGARRRQRCHCSECAAHRDGHGRRSAVECCGAHARAAAWCRMRAPPPCEHATQHFYRLHRQCMRAAQRACCRSSGRHCIVVPAQCSCQWPRAHSCSAMGSNNCCVSPMLLCHACE